MPPVYLGRHWCRLVPVQLSFWDHLLGSRETSGGNGDVTPPLLDHDGGLFSTMTTHDYTSETTVLAATPIRTRKTYPQNWPAYNAAQCSEKDSVMALLGDLCAQIEEPPYKGGRPALSLTDMVYVSTMKTYEGFSARRFNCDVQDARRRGFIQAAPSQATINRRISDPRLQPIIMDLIKRSAAPLTMVEDSFAADSSGFSTFMYDRWHEAKWGPRTGPKTVSKTQRRWVKAHIMAGTKTNVITAVEVTGPRVNDSPVLPGLLDTTAQTFNVEEISADKAYSGESNLRAIEDIGATPYIPFKKRTRAARGSAMWRRLYAYFILNEEEFYEHYHKRSNVETTFSMIKRKFGPSVRSRLWDGQVNEVLLKVLCHNLCVLVQAMHQIGIAPVFDRQEALDGESL